VEEGDHGEAADPVVSEVAEAADSAEAVRPGAGSVHPEMASFGPRRRSRSFSILEIARYACG
jgi:hypothetical protein